MKSGRPTRPLAAGCLLALLALLLPVPARADVYDDNPAAASRGPGDMVVVVRGPDGAIYERHLAGGAWTPWASIGGSTTSGPAAAAYGDAIHVFALGTDYAVFENVLRGGAWSGWTRLGGTGTSAPSAVTRRGTAVLDLAVRGTDNGVSHRWFQPGSGWSPWGAVGGNTTSAPALNSQSPGVLNVFTRGPDRQLWERAWSNSQWSDWMPLAGQLAGAPSAVSRAEGLVDVFARGLETAVWQRHWGGSWGDWGNVDLRHVDSTPAVASDRADHVVLFARSGQNMLVKQWNGPLGWTAWADWGPIALPAPPSPPPPPAPDGLAQIVTGLRCTPPGGRLRVSLAIRHRRGQARPRVRRVVFFVKHGPRRTDRHAPYRAHLRLHRRAGSKGRVYARAYYTRKGSRKVHRKTVSRRFVICG